LHDKHDFNKLKKNDLVEQKTITHYNQILIIVFTKIMSTFILKSKKI